MVFRFLAASNPIIAAEVERTDQYRLSILQRMFKAPGFTGSDLEVRARTFVLAMSMEPAISNTVPKSRRKKYLQTLLTQ